MSKDQKRNWFARHKVLTVILAVIVIGVIASASGGGNSNNGVDGQASNTTKTYRFDDRADKQGEDVEALPGETANVEGVKMTLSGVEYKGSLGDLETAGSGKTYFVADVTLENTTKETQPYNAVYFRLQTAGGQVLDGTFSGSVETLGSGDIVSGGKVSGKILFEVPVEDGHQYVIWKPNAFDAARAVVQVK